MPDERSKVALKQISEMIFSREEPLCGVLRMCCMYLFLGVVDVSVSFICRSIYWL